MHDENCKLMSPLLQTLALSELSLDLNRIISSLSLPLRNKALYTQWGSIMYEFHWPS
jgi:hypothetical protein